MEGEPAELRTSVVSIDPRTGAVRAYFGGFDGAGFDPAAFDPSDFGLNLASVRNTSFDI